jgi:hypothetical protein
MLHTDHQIMGEQPPCTDIEQGNPGSRVLIADAAAHFRFPNIQVNFTGGEGFPLCGSTRDYCPGRQIQYLDALARRIF